MEEQQRNKDGIDNKNILLSVRDLEVTFKGEEGISKAVRGVSFDVEKGKILGIVGESGSGKSVSSLSIMRLIAKPSGKIERGEILFHGEDLVRLKEKEIRKIRGNKIAMIFQEPMSSLNPVFKIGYQLGEALALHQGIKGEENKRKCIEILEHVRIPDPERMLKLYPHELSGGMRQRVMIAMAILCNPELMIADEPTTALDVTIQAQILQLLRELRREKDMSIMFITHDLGVIAEMADRVIVMYAGLIVEEADVEVLLNKPLHPYTEGLIDAIPENFDSEGRFKSILGSQPGGHEEYTGCSFAPRCKFAKERCKESLPDLVEVSPGHRVRCHLREEEGNEQ